jgi:dTDP-4-dehydrorhamnose reductase
MKVWVLGSAGLVGRCLIEFLRKKNVDVVPSNKKSVDITNLTALKNAFHEIKPDYIFNCAAYTAVDDAEENKELALAVNGIAPGLLGKITFDSECHVVHISTDYVFSSDRHTPFNEDDPTSPVNYYGFTKLQGEQSLLRENPRACIVRTSWVYGPGGKNFICSLVELLATKQELDVAVDQIGRPTYCRDLVEALWELKDCSGVFHYASSGAVSRYDIAMKIYEHMKKSQLSVACQKINPVPSTRFKTKAPRPHYSVLNTKKYEQYLNKVPRSWTETLEELFYDA